MDIRTGWELVYPTHNCTRGSSSARKGHYLATTTFANHQKRYHGHFSFKLAFHTISKAKGVFNVAIWGIVSMVDAEHGQFLDTPLSIRSGFKRSIALATFWFSSVLSTVTTCQVRQ